MITINAGKIIIPDYEERFIGFTGDDLHSRKQFIVKNITDVNCSYKLYLEFCNGTVISLELDSKVENGSTILTWEISENHILKSGLIKAQVKSVSESGKTSYTDWEYFIAHPSAGFSEDFEDVDTSDFSEYKKKLNEVYDKVKNTDFDSFVPSHRTVAGIELTDNIDDVHLWDALQVRPTIFKEGAPTVFDGSVGKYLIDTVNDDLYYCKDRTLSGNNWIKLSGSSENFNSIKDAQINASGELVLTYSDDTTDTVGVVLGANGKDGVNGTDGKDGYTPVKGEDYFTDEEKAQIVTQAKAGLSQIEPPTIVKSVDEMTDPSKHYVLNGDIYAYMSGKSGLTPDFTNLADTTLTTDATITTTSNGWLEDVRINSSNAIATADGNDITNSITIGNKSVVRIKNMDINGGYGRIYFYSNGAYLYSMSINEVSSVYFTEINDEYAEITSAKLLECLKANKGSSATFDKIRFGGTLTGTKEDVIITLDEEITYTDSVGYEWTNTGLQYTATLYTDLIGIVDENNVIRLSSNNLPSGTYTLKYGDESFDTIGTITID